jgi:hypothetical protein
VRDGVLAGSAIAASRALRPESAGTSNLLMTASNGDGVPARVRALYSALQRIDDPGKRAKMISDELARMSEAVDCLARLIKNDPAIADPRNPLGAPKVPFGIRAELLHSNEALEREQRLAAAIDAELARQGLRRTTGQKRGGEETSANAKAARAIRRILIQGMLADGDHDLPERFRRRPTGKAALEAIRDRLKKIDASREAMRESPEKIDAARGAKLPRFAAGDRTLAEDIAAVRRQKNSS